VLLHEVQAWLPCGQGVHAVGKGYLVCGWPALRSQPCRLCSPAGAHACVGVPSNCLAGSRVRDPGAGAAPAARAGGSRGSQRRRCAVLCCAVLRCGVVWHGMVRCFATVCCAASHAAQKQAAGLALPQHGLASSTNTQPISPPLLRCSTRHAVRVHRCRLRAASAEEQGTGEGLGC